MNSVYSAISAIKPWNRATIADGIWLNKNDIQPIVSALSGLDDNDSILSGDFVSMIETESAARSSQDSSLETQIINLSKRNVYMGGNGMYESSANLPITGSGVYIYLVGPVSQTGGDDYYEEYIWNGTSYVMIGDSDVDIEPINANIKQISGNLNNVSGTVYANSGNWNSTYNTLLTNSSKYNNSYIALTANSGNWNSTYNTVNNNSSKYESNYNTVFNNSSKWGEAASTSDLSTEITNRTNADTTLQNNIDNEASARTNADTLLQNQINNKISSVTADGVVVDATTVDNAVTISGHQVTVRNTTNTAAPTFGGTLDLYHLNGNDEYGRITGVEKLTITMPSSTATTSAAGLMSSSDKSKLTNTYYAVYPGESKSLAVGTNYISTYTNYYKGAHLTIFQGTTYDTTFTQGDKITLNILDVTSGTTVNATQDFTIPQTGVPFSCVILCYSYNTVASGEHLNFKLTKTSSTSTGTTTFVNATIQDWCINAG